MAGARIGLSVAVLAAPAVLAFFAGGYFDRARLWAAVAAAAGLAVAALVLPRPLPRSAAARMCLAALAGLAGWTALSILWAPVRDAALADAQRVVLYAVFAAAAAAVLRGPRILGTVEPALAAGGVVAVGYGVATRVLPGVIPSSPGIRAANRLDQPLTYWNAVGALAAISLVLAVRVAADSTRTRALRATAAASVPVLSLGLYLTLSRGALVALGAGLVVLAAASPDRRAVAASSAIAAFGGAMTVAAATRLPAVEELAGSADAQGDQGLVMLGALVVVAALSGAAQARIAARGPSLPRAAVAAVAAAFALAAVLLVPAAGDPGSRPPPLPASPPGGSDALPSGPARLRTLETNRLEYWDVALAAFADQPLRGAGAHGFAVEWLERRTIPESVQDAHSLYVETLVELGLVGVLLLAGFLGGWGVCAARLLRSGAEGRQRAAGLTAAAVVYLVHAGIDWDWEMPTLTLAFLVIVGATLAADDERAVR